MKDPRDVPWLKDLEGKLKDIGKASRKDAGWLLHGAAGAGPSFEDVTERFKALQAQIRAGQNPLPGDANHHLYLLVPGLFTRHYPGYMKGNLARLQGLNLLARLSAVDSNASVLANVAVLQREILAAAAEGRKVVLVGHSKGGVDATAALAMHPELLPHVRAVVAMQAPYGGTPIASDLVANHRIDEIISAIIHRILSGDRRALADLTYEARRQFVAKRPYPRAVPTVCLATCSTSPLSLTAAECYYMTQRYGERSDGLVPQLDAIIPGSRVVQLDGLDHAAPAMYNPQSKDLAGELTQALVALALTS